MNEAKVIQCETELLKAMKGSDIEKLDELIHTDLLFNIPNGQTINKTMDLEAYQSGNMNITSLEASEQEIKCVGDNATVVVSVEMKGRFMDQVLDGKYRFIRVWKALNDNQPQVIAGSSVAL